MSDDCWLPPHVRDLTNWPSGSSVQQIHFHAARILWEQISWERTDQSDVETERRLSFSKKVNFSKVARREGLRYTGQFNAWKAYLSDIKNSGDRRSRPWNMALREFSTIRSEQLNILEVKERRGSSTKRQSSTSSRLTRSRAKSDATASSSSRKQKREVSFCGQPEANESKQRLLDDLFTQEISMSLDTNVMAPPPSASHPEGGSGSSESGGFSLILEAHVQTEPASPGFLKPHNFRDTVNASLLYMMFALCIHYDDMASQWRLNKPQWTVELGQAKIVSRPDGVLHDSHGLHKQPFAIVEVKPSTLKGSNKGAALRQMGIEMMCWIYRCEHDGEPRQR
ncbi:hypothetical protein N7486_000732 [Penicillium sp. IBT 16267x]|nr:hypothetical protein N7486_000732 [Penicillium sp. IBT 16267x]